MNANSTEFSAQSQSQSQFRVMPTASGHAMLLSAEEWPVYHLHMTRFLTEFRPESQRECNLVQRITDNEWRIDRVIRLEMGLYARGQMEFVSLYAEEDPNVRSLLIETHTHTTYARQLNSLHLQESRLCRYIQRDLADLRTLQAERNDREEEKKAFTASASSTAAYRAPDPPVKRQNGFEFSTSASTESSYLPTDRQPTATAKQMAGIHSHPQSYSALF